MVFDLPRFGGQDVQVRSKLVDDIPKVLNWWNFVYLADFELVKVNLETYLRNKINSETNIKL